MVSDRPTPQQQTFDFGHEFSEDETAAPVSEPQRGESNPANTEQPSVDSFPTFLMEKIVDTDNMVTAWKKVRRNKGRHWRLSGANAPMCCVSRAVARTIVADATS